MHESTLGDQIDYSTQPAWTQVGQLNEFVPSLSVTIVRPVGLDDLRGSPFALIRKGVPRQLTPLKTMHVLREKLVLLCQAGAKLGLTLTYWSLVGSRSNAEPVNVGELKGKPV